MRSPVDSSYTIVPTGTFRMTDSPSRPVRFEPSPCRPRSALCSGLNRKCTSVLCRSLDSMMTSPPLPPSPPDGPPRGTNFSRRKAMQPFPPSPALTLILASSMNMEVSWQYPVLSCDYLRSVVSFRSRWSLLTCSQQKSLVPKARPVWSGRLRPRNFRTFDCLLRFERLDHHELAHRAFVHELDASADFGEERVVFEIGRAHV